MNGCDSHMASAEPGCANCFHRLMGRYDAQKSESLQNHHAWCSVEELLKDREAKLAAANSEIDQLKETLKESHADADALEKLSRGLYERIQGKPEWVVESCTQTALNYIDYMTRLYDELKRAIWKHLHIKHERTVCPLSVGTPERCCEIIMRDAGLDPADGTAEVKQKGRTAEEDGFEVLTTYKNSTAKCPCGSQFTWEGFDDKLGAWRDEHRPHLRR